MPRGTPIALTTVRIARGQARPAEEVFRQAIERDRVVLNIDAGERFADLTVAGPYPITVDGEDLDEYVVWER